MKVVYVTYAYYVYGVVYVYVYRELRVCKYYNCHYYDFCFVLVLPLFLVIVARIFFKMH